MTTNSNDFQLPRTVACMASLGDLHASIPGGAGASAPSRRSAMLHDVAGALRVATRDATNIHAVIAAAQLSHDEIVEQFGSVSGLVAVLADSLGAFMLAPLDDCTGHEDFTRKLIAFGNRVVDRSGAAQLKALYRVALADSIREPALGREFYRRGPGVVMDGLTRFISNARAAGVPLRGDSRLLASHLMALLRIDLGLPEDASSSAEPGDGTPDHGEVSRMIELFCAGIQRSPEDAYAVV